MNTPLVAALATALILGGIVLGIAGLVPQPDKPARPRRIRKPSLWAGLDRRTQIVLAAAAGIGLVAGLATGWWAAILILPALTVGVPYLLDTKGEDAKIARVEAMEEWLRSLAGTLGAGSSLEQGILATLKSTPEPIQAEVSTLIARINSRTSTRAALRAFADDLDDVIGDKIVAALLLGADRRGAALAGVLDDLASSVADEVRARRLIEADRAKPRTTARWVTILMLLLLGGLAVTGDYVAPYKTALGQLILVTILSVFGLILVWMKRMAATPRVGRFIGADVAVRRTL